MKRPCRSYGMISKSVRPKSRLKQWKELFADWRDCTRCPLHERRVESDVRQMVFGEGDLNADLIFVGEGPGAAEEREGIPFHGPSGGLLNGFLADLDFPREQAFITNAVCCRACEVVEEEKWGRPVRRTANRPPGKKAMDICKERLHKQIYIIDPLIIVALGAPALRTLAGSSYKQSDWLGEILTIEVPGKMTEEKEVGKGKKKKFAQIPVPIKYPCIPTYHPSLLLQRQALDDTSPESPAIKLLAHLEKAVNLVRAYNKIEGGRA